MFYSFRKASEKDAAVEVSVEKVDAETAQESDSPQEAELVHYWFLKIKLSLMFSEKKRPSRKWSWRMVVRRRTSQVF